MSCHECLPLLPLVVLAAAAVIILLAACFWRGHVFPAAVAMIALAMALALTVFGARGEGVRVGELLVVDRTAGLFGAVAMAAGLACAWMAATRLRLQRVCAEEFHVLLLLAVLGAAALVASVHAASFFVSLELLGVSLYGLIAYERGAPGVEAGMKYLVTAGTSSAVLLFGLALMYASQGRGTLNILEMGRNWAAADRSLSGAGLYLRHFAPMLTGLAMVLCGAAFKLGAAPFHLWTADVYQGAGAPATSLIATASKTAMVGLVLRWTAALELNSNVGLALVIAFLAAASMVTGNLLALWQHNLKRVLGYSSIAHMGYVLVLVLCGGDAAWRAAGFYMAAYTVTLAGCWAWSTCSRPPARTIAARAIAGCGGGGAAWPWRWR